MRAPVSGVIHCGRRGRRLRVDETGRGGDAVPDSHAGDPLSREKDPTLAALIGAVTGEAPSPSPAEEEPALSGFGERLRDALERAVAHLRDEGLVEIEEGLVPSLVAEVTERLDKLRLMIDMLSDIEWRLPQQDATRVLNALAYFTEPEDLIPDHIPGLGFLDDAIMIELVVRELRHEIEAYEDFCNYRERVRERGDKTPASRAGWLDARRKDLQARMRRRRRRNGRILS